MLKILPILGKKLILRCGLLYRIIFKLEYLGEFRVEFETYLGYESVEEVDSISDKNKRLNIL